MDTKDKIMDALIQLVTEKGYRGATTRAIAERANVNEITLFRHFGSKDGIMEAAINKYSFVGELIGIVKENFVWDLEKDLKFIAKKYQEQLNEHKDILLISYKEAGTFPEIDEMISQHLYKVKETLMDYFKEMISLGKLYNQDVEAVVTHFLLINAGFFLLNLRLNDDSQMLLDDFLNKQVTLLVNSIKTITK
ncbi:TetR/AcrR family transcriptional regulator [Pseudogracilibacillus sp. SO30301A]|uniref:TetR/AcrR family transcriptional regulator n=1 Tax=Pseudogracilibacillus sp. SO30301A TaxID=3098291 RepID=UPI00300E0215